MKVIPVFFLFLQSLATSLAQPTLQWQKAIGGSHFEQSYDISATSDGGVITVGATGSTNGDVQNFHGLVDFFVVKQNAQGQIEWSKAYGGSHHDWAYSVQQTPDLGYIVGGSSVSEDGQVSGGHGYNDGWLIKLDAGGAIEWQKCIGGSNDDEIWDLYVTSDSGYVATGYSRSLDGDAKDNFIGIQNLWVLKLSRKGEIEWIRFYGGSYDDYGRSIKQTSDGGYIIGGDATSTDGDVEGSNGNVEFWILKLNKDGMLEWQHPLGGIGADACFDVIEVSDGYVGVGIAGSNDGDITGYKGFWDSWLVKLNKSGELQWQKALGGSDADYGRTIIEESEGVYVVSGEARSHDGDLEGTEGILYAWVYKITKTGQIIWSKTYGGSQGETASAMCRTTDGNYVTAGIAWSNDGDVTGVHGECDFWIVKLSEQNSAVGSPAVAPLEVFPNPVKDRLQVQFPEGGSRMDVTISDLLGRVFLRKTLSTGEEIDMSTTAQGVFLLEAVDESGRRYRGKCSKW